MTDISADKPTTDDGCQYHLETRSGDLADRCLLVGSPERAEMIAKTYFTDAIKVGHHRGLRAFSGKYQGKYFSVVTTGMGSASTGIVLPEAVRSGARAFIRVGSCGVLHADLPPGSSCVCKAAVRLDGASENWAPIQYPAFADPHMAVALERAARRLDLEFPWRAGVGITTTCFNEGQARPDDNGYIPPRIKMMHDELVQRGALFYSMEEATLFVWCATHGEIPCGAVDAVYANRLTKDFATIGDEQAARIALEAFRTFDFNR
ncbi:MAG: nucleoside phosphorylase [Patescibacteria group bacterium]|nr:nucleoside phosphorylase [Patescibacteria group bacterium]